ncbi:DNA polymerase III subunit delta [Sphingomonas montana]|uniref:DNA polymerase III subunit delta n=1 Tax=Sphingomonas montana TaxID=1843236 RepID=UPI000970133B|nr:DNA polymerase III subunit delta [Sphingomonas montana]
MILKRPQMERALDKPDPGVRMFLLYGPDESGSRELAGRLGKALPGAERIDLTGAGLKADPARLSDEAMAMSLFGDKRYIRVEPAGDDMIDAAEALMEAPGAGNPVVVVAGALRKDAKLVKLATARLDVMACISYLPEGGEADRIALSMGQSRGVRMGPEIAQRLAAASGGDRALLAQEIDKFALYLDAAPDRPMELDAAGFAALSADAEEGDVGALVNATFDGDLAVLEAALARIDAAGEAIPVLRALGRRALLLSNLRAEVAGGSSVDHAMATAGKAVFFKERGIVAGQVARWNPKALARTIERLAAAERDAKSSRSAGGAGLGEELFAIGRQARRGR